MSDSTELRFRLSYQHLTERLLKITIGEGPEPRSFAVVNEPLCCTGGMAWRVIEGDGYVDIEWGDRYCLGW